MATIVSEQALQLPAFLAVSSTYQASNLRRTFKVATAGATGVVGNGFLVSPNGTPNMTVLVAAGQAVAPGFADAIREGAYLLEAFAQLPAITIPAADATNDRIDLICLLAYDQEYAGTVYNGTAGVVKGTPSSTPAVPSLPTTADSVSAVIPLAQVRVPHGATSIIAANITDVRPAYGNRIGLLGRTNPIFGGTPPLAMGGSFLFQAGNDVVNTNAGGGFAISYPTPFPNGVLAAFATVGDNNGNPLSVMFINGNMQQKAGLNGQIYNGTTPFVSTVARLNWLAIGW